MVKKGLISGGLQPAKEELYLQVPPAGAVCASGRGRFTVIACPRGSGVEHFLGKEGVTGSNPVVGSRGARAFSAIARSQPVGPYKNRRKVDRHGEGEV